MPTTEWKWLRKKKNSEARARREEGAANLRPGRQNPPMKHLD